MRIHILALNGVFDTGLAAVLDAFGTANALAEMTGISSLRFQMRWWACARPSPRRGG